MKYLGSASTCCNEDSINDYLSNISSELFRFENNGKYSGYNPGHGIPKNALPQLKAWYGSFRNSPYKPKFLGDKIITSIKIRRLDDFERIDAIEDGFDDLETFKAKLIKLHKKDLITKYRINEDEPKKQALLRGVENHYWIQMRYMWLSGPIHIPIPSKNKW